MQKKGQVTNLVILGIVIVAIIVFAIFAAPRLNIKKTSGDIEDIETYLKECMDDPLRDAIISKEFIAQGSIYLGELWLQERLKEDFISRCSDVSRFAGAAGDVSSVTIDVEIDGTNFNDITKVLAVISYDVIITQGEFVEEFDKFSIEAMPPW
ncbi:MAG: hypothetical protein AABW49_01045 [Nanoarchaeota archaeon]